MLLIIREYLGLFGLLTGINMFFCWFLGMFTTGRYYYKLLNKTDELYIKHSFLPKVMGRPIIFSLYIVFHNFFKNADAPLYYEDFSIFKNNIRWLDYYVAYSMVAGFIVTAIIMVITKTLDYLYFS